LIDLLLLNNNKAWLWKIRGLFE